MKNLLVPVACAMAVFLVVVGFYALRQNRTLDGINASVAATHAEMQKQLAEAQRTVQEHEREVRDAQATIAQLQRELAVARAAAGLETDRERVDASPGLAEFRQRQQRRIVQERYGDLFDRLGLSPLSLEEFKRLLVELEATSLANTGSTATETVAAPSPPAGRTSPEIHDEIYNLLGYEGYMAFDRFGRELTSARPLVRRFANDAADAGIPLTVVQRTALSRVIFEATDPQVNADAVKPGANTPDPTTGLTPLDQLVLARASDVLSPAQLELLQNFRIHERAGLAAWRDALAPAEATP